MDLLVLQLLMALASDAGGDEEYDGQAVDEEDGSDVVAGQPRLLLRRQRAVERLCLSGQLQHERRRVGVVVSFKRQAHVVPFRLLHG